MNRILRRFLRRSDAATAVEYGVMLALILMAVFVAVTTLGLKNNQSWNNTNTSLEAANVGS